MTDLDRGLLETYLSDHIAGATAGAGRVRRMADAYARTPLGPDLARVAEEITAEREWLISTADQLGVQPSRVKQAGAWVGEHVGRLKPNGRFASTSPLSALLELEMMRSAVVGKRGVWETLRIWADELGLDKGRLDHLLARADAQLATLGSLAMVARHNVFDAQEPGVVE